ncbi:unnamed protein product [Symbiodinium natans]|uniref:Uncharacterized protein n=1 Tax=Symbiodinium natans TaxID=878477 RepID=A0A812TBG2_9DINO|nr:unnamed protein product [Symbiodinium natans]
MFWDGFGIFCEVFLDVFGSTKLRASAPAVPVVMLEVAFGHVQKEDLLKLEMCLEISKLNAGLWRLVGALSGYASKLGRSMPCIGWRCNLIAMQLGLVFLTCHCSLERGFLRSLLERLRTLPSPACVLCLLLPLLSKTCTSTGTRPKKQGRG